MDFLKNKDYYLLLEELFGRSTHTMDDLLDKLKERGYCLQDWEVVEKAIKFKIPEKYQGIPYAVKRISFDSSKPENDKYEYSLILGIDYYGKRRQTIPVFLRGEKLGVKKLPWPESHRNFKEKKAGVSFPAYMTIEERKDWRAIHRKIMNGRKPTDFYLEHVQAIKDLNPNFIFEN